MNSELPAESPELLPATPGHEPILATLLDAYAREFSQFHLVAFNDDGTFTYLDLPGYFRDSGKHAFLILIGGTIAGFALIRLEHISGAVQPSWDVAEFYVAPPFRRRGTGTSAAHRLWSQFSGPWQVRVLSSNQPALRFWQSAIKQFTLEPAHSCAVQGNGELWHVFSFNSPPVPGPSIPALPVH